MKDHQVSQANILPHAHYMRPLDGIRGMACMFVIASHISQILHLCEKQFNNYVGSLGVVLFFTLSGFLMGRLYSDERFTWDNIVKYMTARFTRIAPAYWIAVVYAWILYLNIPDFHYQMTPFMMVRSLFFGGNQGVFWSIPPEVQFYGFFVLLWFAASKYKGGNIIWPALVGLLCVAFIVTRNHWGGLTLPSKLHIFLSGFIMALVARSDLVKKYIQTLWFQTFATAALCAAAILFIDRDNVYGGVIFPAIAGLWIACMSSSTCLTKPFETNTMRLIGAASFSIYLLHDATLIALHDTGWFGFDVQEANMAIMVLISLAIPVAFHFFVEKKLNILSKKKCLELWEGLKARYPALKG